MSQFRQVIPDIYTAELPLPFELESVNVHLIRLDEGWLLIDTGMETDAAFEELSQALRGMGVEWTDIRQILLTHMHPDHMGMAERILALSGAQLLMHEVEAEHLRTIARGSKRVPWIDTVFVRAGVAGEMRDRMDRHFSQIRKNFKELAPARVFVGGEVLQTAAGPFRVLWTPGHSPGHICLYSEPHRLLISGDQILEFITPNISWQPERDTLGEYLDSLRSLHTLDVETVVPSHGKPFVGHRDWIDSVVEHHRERCDEMVRLLGETPRTADALVGTMWRRKLSPINHHFAVFEVLAHLEHLQRQGRVQAQEQEGGALEWAPGSGPGMPPLEAHV